MDGSEIGGVVALAAHMRNRVFDEKELDFLLPHSVTAANSSIVITLVKSLSGDFMKDYRVFGA
jgi:hypothetical protein